MLVYGPTGVGKTALVQAALRAAPVASVRVSASEVTPAAAVFSKITNHRMAGTCSALALRAARRVRRAAGDGAWRCAGWAGEGCSPPVPRLARSMCRGTVWESRSTGPA